MSSSESENSGDRYDFQGSPTQNLEVRAEAQLREGRRVLADWERLIQDLDRLHLGFNEIQQGIDAFRQRVTDMSDDGQSGSHSERSEQETTRADPRTTAGASRSDVDQNLGVRGIHYGATMDPPQGTNIASTSANNTNTTGQNPAGGGISSGRTGPSLGTDQVRSGLDDRMDSPGDVGSGLGTRSADLRLPAGGNTNGANERIDLDTVPKLMYHLLNANATGGIPTRKPKKSWYAHTFDEYLEKGTGAVSDEEGDDEDPAATAYGVSDGGFPRFGKPWPYRQFPDPGSAGAPKWDKTVPFEEYLFEFEAVAADVDATAIELIRHVPTYLDSEDKRVAREAVKGQTSWKDVTKRLLEIFQPGGSERSREDLLNLRVNESSNLEYHIVQFERIAKILLYHETVRTDDIGEMFVLTMPDHIQRRLAKMFDRFADYKTVRECAKAEFQKWSRIEKLKRKYGQGTPQSKKYASRKVAFNDQASVTAAPRRSSTGSAPAAVETRQSTIMNCLYCSGKDHLKGQCPFLSTDLSDGKIKLDDRGRVLLPNGDLLRFTPGTSLRDSLLKRQQANDDIKKQAAATAPASASTATVASTSAQTSPNKGKSTVYSRSLTVQSTRASPEQDGADYKVEARRTREEMEAENDAEARQRERDRQRERERALKRTRFPAPGEEAPAAATPRRPVAGPSARPPPESGPSTRTPAPQAGPSTRAPAAGSSRPTQTPDARPFVRPATQPRPVANEDPRRRRAGSEVPLDRIRAHAETQTEYKKTDEISTQTPKRQPARTKMLTPAAFKQLEKSHKDVMRKLWGTTVALTMEEIVGIAPAVANQVSENVRKKRYPIEDVPGARRTGADSQMHTAETQEFEDAESSPEPEIIEIDSHHHESWVRHAENPAIDRSSETLDNHEPVLMSRNVHMVPPAMLGRRPWEVTLSVSAVPKIAGRFNDVRMEALLDKGSEINCMSREAADRMNAPVVRSHQWTLGLANGGRYKQVGYARRVEVDIGGARCQQDFLVTDHPGVNVILGRPWERKMRAAYEERDDGSSWCTIRTLPPGPDNLIEFQVCPSWHPRDRAVLPDDSEVTFYQQEGGDAPPPKDEPVDADWIEQFQRDFF